MACFHDVDPLTLPYSNVSIAGNQVLRGIALGIGTPTQFISFRPMTESSHMAVFNSTTCFNDSLATCAALTGGLFDSESSNTFSNTSLESWNGSIWAMHQGYEYEYFNDVVHLSNGKSVGDLPMVIYPPVSGGAQAFVGIGTNSTFLDALVEQKAAPTRNWGLWAGSRSVQQPADGALSIGGYDTDRVVSDFTAFRSTAICDCCTVVTNMTYVTRNSSSQIFYADPHDSTFWIDLNPSWNGLTVPPDVFDSFLQSTGGQLGTESANVGLITMSPDADLGDMVVTLRGGYNTTIPAHELFLPPRYSTEDGTYAITNDSYLYSTIFNQSASSTGSLLWGLPFFAMNYMVLDLDYQVFKLAEARQGRSSEDSRSSIRRLCKTQGFPSGASTATPAPTSTSTPAASSGSRSEIGTIVGIVIGCVAFLVLSCLLIWILAKRKKRRQQAQEDKYQMIPSEWENTSLQYTPHSMTQQTDAFPDPYYRVPQARRTDYQSLLPIR